LSARGHGTPVVGVMTFWRLYLGIAAVGGWFWFLGGAMTLVSGGRRSPRGLRRRRPTPRHAAGRSAPVRATREDPGARDTPPPPNLGQGRLVGLARSTGTVSSSLGVALIVSAGCVMAVALSIEALYRGGQSIFGDEWVTFLDGILG
jgi:hypothetical protein